MAEKKDRGRFTLRLNEKDPAHAKVIRVLEQQPPHSVGRFIANAILHYVHCRETPDISVGQTPDRVAIETMIRDILRQQGTRDEEDESGEQNIQSEKSLYLRQETEVSKRLEAGNPKDTFVERKELPQSDVEDNTRMLIQNTLSAFRNHNE